MTKQTEKPEIVVTLEELFNEINNHLFGGELELPTMILQPERRLDFNFVADTYHFVIGGRFIEFKSVDEMHQQFLHEMVHVKLSGNEGKNSSNYHNAAFLEAALDVGLYVWRNRTIGWGFTSFHPPKNEETLQTPSNKVLEARESLFNECKFDSNIFVKAKQDIKSLRKNTGRPKQYFLKYICNCPEPHNSIRSGRRPDSQNPLNCFCGDCGYSYVCVDSSGDPVKDQQQKHILEFVQERYNVGVVSADAI